MNIIEVRNAAELRDWFEENINTAEECWIVNTIKSQNNVISYLDIVEVAICYGWIDSTKKKLPDGRTIQRISKRSKKSNWTRLNQARAERMIKLGLMTEYGYETLPEFKPFVIDPLILASIKGDPITYGNFLNLPQLYIEIKLDNIQNAKIDEITYQKRLDKFLMNTKKNKLYGSWNDDGRLS